MMHKLCLTAGAIALALATGLTATPTTATAHQAPAANRPDAPIGTVLSHDRLPRRLWIPGTSTAYQLTYVTTDAHDHKAVSGGAVFIPHGRPPEGGWPVVSWAHGTQGIGDRCAPSRIGPVSGKRDFDYLATWLRQGYAIVETDYVGLGTPGIHPYLDNRPAAHNVVDMVLAGRRLTATRQPREHLASKWVVIGQSQGGGVSIYTARYATAFGLDALDYRGAVGTGTPANLENVVQLAGPEVVAPLTPGLTAYLLYILAGFRSVHPEVGVNSALTAEGKKYVEMAEHVCVIPFEEELDGVVIGDLFTQPLVALPGFPAKLKAYMGMPTDGFDKPFFIGHGLVDTDVPYPTTAAYVAELTANGEPVEFHSYPTNHNTTLAASLADSVPFVAGLFRD
jgi:hypothetical protein